MAPTSIKPPQYDPRDLCHPEEIEAVKAECAEDDKAVDSEEQDIEVGSLSDGSEFSSSQDSSQDTDLTSSQSTVHYIDS